MGKLLTEEGKKFIRTVVSGNGTSKISGKNKWNLRFSTLENTPTTFTANATDHLGKPIKTNEQLAEALIFWFNKYGKEYDLDSNVLAAQAYQESLFIIWNYAGGSSTAIGITQFVESTFYDVVMKNKGPLPNFTSQEQAKLTAGTQSPTLQTSYKNFKDGSIAKNNRVRLHQNVMDNPDLMIKAQCKLMKYISNNNNGFASSTLFAYNRGSELRSSNYVEVVKKTVDLFNIDYIDEGVNYVEKIFGFLGDKNNEKIVSLGKPKGVWFGYDIDFEFDDFKANLG